MNDIIKLKDVGTELDSIVDPLVGLLFPDQATAVSVAHVALKIPSTIRDYRLYQKFGHFVTAIREEDLNDSVKFSSQLFYDEKTARENALRFIQYIDQAETIKVIGYMVNASRAVGNQLINENECYQVLWALTNTFPEDLHYFKEIATEEDVVRGNTQIVALAQSGLMISAGGMDANRSVEDQDYAVTSFGVMVDRYALSLDDEDRWVLWKTRDGQGNCVNFKTDSAEINGSTLVLH